MKKLLIMILILGLASAANAALTLVGAPESVGIGETATVTLQSTEDGTYSAWLQVEDPSILNFDVAPELTAAGDPAGDSQVTKFAGEEGWYELQVTSFDPTNPIQAGDHVLANVIGVSEGLGKLNLFADDGVTLIECAEISVIPEPATIALLGLGGLLAYRRKK
jgi:hypothetical protein